jgi:hypothetical protein
MVGARVPINPGEAAMAGFTQTVRCLRHYADGHTDIAWEVKMYYPANDAEAFMAQFDRPTVATKGPIGYSYCVLFDATPVKRKPVGVQRWTD